MAAPPTAPPLLRFRCPACGRLVGIAERMAGRPVACPGCRKTVTVPVPTPPPASTDGSDDGGFRVRRRRSEVEDLDLTPMVDVTFLLLIFFMVTASFSSQKSLEVPPPDPESQGASPLPVEEIEANSVVVRVEPGDAYFVDDARLAGPDDLAAAVARAMADGGRTELLIEAAGAARHEAVVRAYDAGNEAGVQRIRLTSPAE